MTFLNIGPLEFILIFIVMFILLGPEGMIKTARQLGTWIRKTVRSPMWGEVMGYSRDIRDLPTKFIRDTGLDEDLKEIQMAASEATRETQESLNQAKSEIDQSLKETGGLEIKIDGKQQNPKPAAATIVTKDNSSADMIETSSSLAQETSVETLPQPVVEEPKPPVVID
jgi:Sec-independent protein translocase protein TatA